VKKKKNGNKSSIKPWVRWHRRVGIFFAIPAVLLAITGILLNHSQLLNLDKIYIANSAILDWYGMEPNTTPKSIAINNNNILTLLEDSLYLNGNLILENSTAPTGGGEMDEYLIASTEDIVLLLGKKGGAVIEKLDKTSLPRGKILASAVRNEKFLMDTTEGRFSATPEMINFSIDEREELPGATSTKVSEVIMNKILNDWRGRGLSAWRVVLDLHSGKFFGKIGTFIADVFAIFLLLLVASGFYLWRRRPSI
jgi:hypothetical protein